MKFYNFIEKFKEKLQEKGIAIIVFDQKENGRYIYNGKNQKYN